ncbi:MAG: hypothetical protein ABIE55_04610 [Candidatus Aenigmatarchaeota archaeon]
MKRKKTKHIHDIYMGGERDPEKLIIPEDLGKFFDKKMVFLVFFVLLIMLLIAGVGL